MIRKAEYNDMPVLGKLAGKLWPGHTPGELESELSGLLRNPEGAFFLAWEGTLPAGFAQCQLRRDYVEGTETSPVGYLEGIFVEDAFRHRGFARQLLAACEAWSAGQGCVEFASDCELDNTLSRCFHSAMGFQEANRIVCFVKKLPG